HRARGCNLLKTHTSAVWILSVPWAGISVMTKPMSRPFFLSTLLLAAHCFVASATELAELACLGARSAAAPADSSELRKYAPDRAVDISHLLLDVTPDFQKRAVSGTMTLRFKPISKPLRELSLDAVDLSISQVTSGEKIQAYQNTGKKLI